MTFDFRTSGFTNLQALLQLSLVGLLAVAGRNHRVVDRPCGERASLPGGETRVESRLGEVIFLVGPTLATYLDTVEKQNTSEGGKVDKHGQSWTNSPIAKRTVQWTLVLGAILFGIGFYEKQPSL